MAVVVQFKGIFAFLLAPSTTVAYLEGICASLFAKLAVVAQFKGIFAFYLAPSTTVAYFKGIVTVHSTISAT
ncbi:hypothetical protein NST50_26915 [Paenibacillus sp. FSL E2-0202]|uniref:hypothetical protein n=1 Tax=unclassified Paenibacillus TaxID=185978 RepID=UPI0030ED69A9